VTSSHPVAAGESASISDGEALLAAARAAVRSAYVPYSGFPVGAAVLSGGQVFSGCNIESASYGLTICAERVAIFAAVATGRRMIEALALTCPCAAELQVGSRMPCGACRQVMAEFAAPGFRVLVDGVGIFSLEELLPAPFLLPVPR